MTLAPRLMQTFLDSCCRLLTSQQCGSTPTRRRCRPGCRRTAARRGWRLRSGGSATAQRSNLARTLKSGHQDTSVSVNSIIRCFKELACSSSSPCFTRNKKETSVWQVQRDAGGRPSAPRRAALRAPRPCKPACGGRCRSAGCCRGWRRTSCLRGPRRDSRAASDRQPPVVCLASSRRGSRACAAAQPRNGFQSPTCSHKEARVSSMDEQALARSSGPG